MLKGKATTGGADFEMCPAGNHPGVCIGLIDLGTHWESFQGGAEKKLRKVLLVWEVEVEEDGKDKRLVIGRDYNVAIDPKTGALNYGSKSNIRLMLEGWRGKAYGPEDDVDLEVVHGKACLVNVTHKKTAAGKDVARVESVSNLPKGMAALKPTREKVLYSADSREGVPGQEWLPRVFGEKITDVIPRSLEWGGDGRTGAGGPGGQGPPAANGQAVDDGAESIPF